LYRPPRPIFIDTINVKVKAEKKKKVDDDCDVVMITEVRNADLAKTDYEPVVIEL